MSDLGMPVRDLSVMTELQDAVSTCRACDLHRFATHAVPGAGPAPAVMMMLGEQPLRTENRTGESFVGRAGLLLRRALADADVDPDGVYFTSVVKHSRFQRDDSTARHIPPDPRQVKACLPWLLAELQLVRPRVMVLLGSVPARALLGPGVSTRGGRGQPIPAPASLGLDPAPTLVITSRPTSVRTSRHFEADYARLVADLRTAARYTVAW